MNIASYRNLKAAGHVTLGEKAATDEELLKIYVSEGALYADQTTFDSVNGERSLSTGEKMDFSQLQNQYGQFLTQRLELKRQLEKLESVLPEYREILKDFEALLEAAAV